MSTTQEPSSAPELPTPHAPGFWPATPAAGTYNQSEGPLEAAGRSLEQQDHPHQGLQQSPDSVVERDVPASRAAALAPVILATGAGLILGGPVVGVLGGLAVGASELENEGLKKGLAHTDTPNHQLNAQHGDNATSTSTSGIAASDVEDDTEAKTQAALASSPAQQMLGDDAKADLGALMAGGAGATVVEKEFVEPKTDLTEHMSDPAVSNVMPDEAIGASSASATTGAAEEQLLPTDQESDRGLSDKEKLALGAGAGLGAGGLAAAALGRDAHQETIRNNTLSSQGNQFAQGSSLPQGTNFSEGSSTSGTSASLAQKPTTTMTTNTSDQEPEHGLSQKEKMAIGTGAAGVGAGGLAAAAVDREAHEGPTTQGTDSTGLPTATTTPETTLGGQEKKAEAFPAQNAGDAVESTTLQPVASPSDPPIGSWEIPKPSEQARQAAVPGEIETIDGSKRANELNAQDGQQEQGKDDDHNKAVLAGGAVLGGAGAVGAYEMLKGNHQASSGSGLGSTTLPFQDTFGEQRAVSHDPTIGQDFSNDKVDPASLVTPAATTVPGFAARDSTAKQDFAHLSQQPNAESNVLLGQEDRRHEGLSTGEKVGAGVAAGAGVGLGAAALAQHDQATQPGITTNASLQRVLDDSTPPGGESSKPSSTRAIKGSPVGTPVPEDYRGSPLAAGADTRTGAYDDAHVTRAYDDAYTTHSEAPIVEQSSADAQRQFLEQHPEVHPVERSPHMKIATHKDASGHKRLHKKSLGDVLIPSGAMGGSDHGSPLSGGSRQQSPEMSQGEGVWNTAVGNVVHDETAHRHGHAPGLVSANHDDRRDHVMDRMVGVQDPASPSRSSGEHHRKLTRNRRPSRDEGASPTKKEGGGFFSKMFGGGKRNSVSEGSK